MPRIKFVFNIFHLYLWSCLITDALVIEVRQSTTNKTVQNGEKKIQSRNPRLIQHIPYYTTAAGQQTNPAHNKVTAPLPNQPQQYLYESDDVQQIVPPIGYAYVPIAYLPGIRTVAYSSHAPSPTSRPITYEYHRNPSTTSSQIQYSTTTVVAPTITNTNNVKKVPAFVFDRFPPSNSDIQASGNYLLPPNATPATPSVYNVKLHPVYTFEYQQPEKVSVFGNIPPSQYLNFRYSNLRQQANIEPSTTPATVEITSPKHYVYSSTTTTPKSQTYYIPPAATHFEPVHKPEFAHVTFTSSPSSISETQASVLKSFRPETIATTESRQVWYNIQPNHTQISYSAVRADDSSAYDILSDYNNNHRLPERITPDNLKESIRTLSFILQMLRKADSIAQFHRQPYTSKVQHEFEDTRSASYVPSVDDSKKSAKVTNHVDVLYDSNENIYNDDLRQRVTSHLHPSSYVPQLPHKASTTEQNVPGRAGIDYPTYSVTPETTFSCKTQRYKGFFADPDTKCQVWHYCDLNGGQASFLCPNGTIFSQVALTCDWWFNVKCAATPQLYVLNERLYKYIIPMQPSFPEDYSGPLVDQYLTEKFREIESQRKHRPSNNSEYDNDVNSTVTTTINTESPKLNLTFFKSYDIPTHLLDENL